MSFTDVNFHNVPEDNECIINAVQLGKRIDEPPSTIRTWAESYEDYLYIKKINGRFVYTEASVDQFRFIKEMHRNKGMSHKQIADIISKHGFQYGDFNSGLVDPKDPLGYQALASAIAVENQKQLAEFLSRFVQYQEENNKLVIEKIKNEVALTVDEIVDDKFNEFKEEFIKEQQKEREATFKTMDMVSNLNAKLEERKEEYNNKKGFLSRLLGK
ncbi:MerR family transcriptional regulator [Clostridium sp. 1001283B150210_160208_E6]|uniref:MerR family transcriptional regulator n=1 Tax=Clostridium sp. 1001283B150210_160208_E6 TaxID=2787129 RepID=UPI0018AC0C00|nr:MerR family transcriptional regulator [Clostridium sp. 1001283B150210_160208_E6]